MVRTCLGSHQTVLQRKVVCAKANSFAFRFAGFLANATEGRPTTQISVQELGPFQATVFPLGSIHYQFNNQCEPATFIATFNSADPGTSQVAQNYFFLDDEIVSTTLGDVNQIDGENIEEFRLSLPTNLVQAVDTCLAKCGLKK